MSAPVIADHAVLRQIGVGAYGEVWLARSTLGAWRAVKVVRRERFDDPRAYEREFGGLQRFEPVSRAHEGLVDVLQVGRDDAGGFFYYVMELADDAEATGLGMDPDRYVPLTLRERMRRNPRLAVPSCVQLGAALAAALEFLHGQGLVHRDIKPSNIVFVGGQPKLADVGLVASLEDAKSFVGTEGFIAPEGPGSARSDLYSIGKVLYEIATGRSRLDYPEIPDDLFVGEDGGAFAELNEVILRACAPVAADRYASAGELRAELLLLEAGRSVRTLRRNERLMALWQRLGAAALLCALIVAGALYFERQRSAAARAVAAAEARLRHALEEREAAARLNLYAADMNLAQQALDAGNYGRAEALLAGYAPLPGRTDIRAVEWFHFWQRLRGDSLAVLQGHQEVVSSLVLSGDGNRLFSASFDATVREWSMESWRELRRWHCPGSLFMTLALDPRGQWIAGEGGNRPMSSLLDLGRGVWRTNVSSASPSVAFTPDGVHLLRGARALLFETNAGLELIDREFRVVKTLPEAGSRVCFAPDGRSFASGPWNGWVRLWSWPGLELLASLPGHGTVMALQFSPDGSRLACATREGRLSLWQVQERRLLAERTAHGGSPIWALAFLPDGARIATGATDQTVRTWRSERLEEDHVYRGHGGEVWAVLWSADGKRLLSAGKDATIRAWAAVPPRPPPPVAEVASAPQFSSDGRHVAVRQRNGAATVRELESGKQVFRLEGVVEIGGFEAKPAGLHVLRQDGGVEFWEVTSGERRGRWESQSRDGEFTRRALSPDGRWLVSGLRQGDILVETCEKPGIVTRLQGHQDRVLSLAFQFRTNGTWLASGGIDRTARLWDLQTQRQVHSFGGHRMGVGSVSFSADGRFFATGSWDDTVQIWDLSDFRKIAVLGGHQGGVQALTFSPDRRTLVSLSGTGVLTFWSLAAQREAGVLLLGSGIGQGWLSMSAGGEWIGAVNQAERLTLIPAPRTGGEKSR